MRRTAVAFSTLVAAAMLAPEALAHHPMGGTTPATFWHGLLSGLGHPILGLDHFAAVVAAGCIAATRSDGLGLALTYVLVMLAGAAVHAMGIGLPAAEILAALAVVALGAVLIWRHAIAPAAAFALFAVAGLVHGHVLAESIVGAEPMPLLAYFIGLGAVQAAIVAGIVFAARALLAPVGAASKPIALRAAGAIAIVLGVWFLVQNVVAAA
jgi:urease accessory protein